MKCLECKSVASSIIEKVKNETQSFILKENRRPGLAVILVGDNPSSITYVRKKEEKAEEVGFVHFQYNKSEDCTEKELIDLIEELNSNNSIDGILVQLPLPSHISEKKVIEHIAPEKDVDGFTSLSLGKLLTGEETFIPCTPKGILSILKYYNIETKGKRVVVLGRSNIVGKPIANILMQKGYDATVTICNSFTPQLREITLESDIVILAMGKPCLIDSSFIKDGAVVIDVGVTRIKDDSKKSGFRLSGDALYSSFQNREISITPVPGGVGLMTVGSLMENTLLAAIRRQG